MGGKQQKSEGINACSKGWNVDVCKCDNGIGRNLVYPTQKSKLFAQARYGNIELFAVFGHGTAGDVVAPVVEYFFEFIVR